MAGTAGEAASKGAAPAFLFSHRGALGDFLLTLPALLSLRCRFRDHRFVGLGKPDYLALAAAFGVVDESHHCEASHFLPFYQGRDLPGSLEGTEHALLWMEPDPRLDALLRRRLSGTVHFHAPFPDGREHVMDHHLKALAPFGLPMPAVGEDLYFPLAAVREPFALIHPGSGSESKNFDPHFYSFVASELKNRRFPDTRIILGPGEGDLRPVYQEGGHAVEEPADCLALARLLSRCSLFIGNDSGVSHLAALTGTPALVLYKHPNWDRWGARGRHVHHADAANEAMAMARLQRLLQDIL